jgi:hypothetical protein
MARGIRPGVVAALLATWLFSCGDDGEGEPAARAVEERSSSSPAGPVEPGHGVEAEDPAPAHFRRLEGTVTLAGAAARPDQAIEAEQPIEVPEGGRAVVQLRDGGRVEIDGGSRARVVEEGAAQVLLVRGALYAVQPPAGNAPRPPLRVVAPSATVEIGRAGEIYLATFANGASWVTVLGGSAAVSNGEADVRRRLNEVELGAGRAVAVPARIAEPTEGPSRLSGARAAAAALADGATPAAPEDRRQTLAHEAERLDQALRWLETETRRGRELTNEHRAAVREGRTEEAQRLQRELVEHSRSLYRLRRLATARWERLRVQQLRLEGEGAAPAEDPVEARRDRVAGLLGL